MTVAAFVPLESSTRDDIDARRLLQRAYGAFQKWPEDFPGFSAAIQCREADHLFTGVVSVFPGGHVELRGSGHDALAAWARRALAAISRARTPRFFKDADGRFAIALEPDDGHPLGRAVRVDLGGPRWRRYRIDGKSRIRERADAHAAGCATVTFQELMRACPGRVLPTRIRIVDWDGLATGADSHSAAATTEIEDVYERFQHAWVPIRRRATVVRGQDRRELSLELTAHAGR